MILGTRLWYAFFNVEDEAVLEERLDSVCREIGDSGKLVLSEAVPKARAVEPAPALVRAPAPAPAPRAPAPAPAATLRTPDRGFSPSMQQPSSTSPTPVGHGAELTRSVGGMSLLEVTAFMDKQRDRDADMRREMEAKMEMHKQETDKLREQVSEAKIQEIRKELEAKMKLQEAKMPQLASAVISEARLEALQARVHALHSAKLLTDEELYTIEDTIADMIEATPTMLASHSTAERVLKMALLSEKMSVEGSFARQLRRKLG
jgi:hypothetical protein